MHGATILLLHVSIWLLERKEKVSCNGVDTFHGIESHLYVRHHINLIGGWHILY